MAIKTHDGLDVAGIFLNRVPIQRVWAGNLLIWERPDVPRITTLDYHTVGDSALLSWLVFSTQPVLAQTLTRVNPDGSRFPITVGPHDRVVNVGVVHASGVTTFEVTATSAAGTGNNSVSRTINARPSVHLAFQGFLPQPASTVILARFAFSYTPGYPSPTSTVAKVSGPGSAPPASIANWIRRGLRSGTLTVTGDSSYRGQVTTLRLTLTNSQGTVHADASCAW